MAWFRWLSFVQQVQRSSQFQGCVGMPGFGYQQGLKDVQRSCVRFSCIIRSFPCKVNVSQVVLDSRKLKSNRDRIFYINISDFSETRGRIFVSGFGILIRSQLPVNVADPAIGFRGLNLQFPIIAVLLSELIVETEHIFQQSGRFA